MARSFRYLHGVTTLKLDRDTCTGCATCLDVCPHAVLAKENGKVRIQDPDACMECGACSRNCPVGAITVKTGVGCAAAVINAALGRNKSSCCCIIEDETNGGSGAEPSRSGKSACC